MTGTILTPAAILILWTLVMLGWMAATRGPELKKLPPGKLKPGGRGQDLEGVIDDRINWKAHNYTHLHEQPTLFYATVLILALAGFTALDVLLAWAYVLVRIVHSFWQALVNRIPVRVSLFMISTAILLVLAVRASLSTLA
jgi:hypothetical protein